MSTPPIWPVPEPERPSPYSPPTGRDDQAAPPPPPPWQTPPPGQPEQPTQSPYSPAGYPEAPAPGYGYPPAASGYGYPQAPAPGYPGPPSAPPYGYGPDPGYGYPPPVWANPQPPMDGLAIASLVTSCAGLVVGISAPVGIGLGIASLRKIRRTGARGRGLAWAGIAVGSVITLVIVGFFLLVLGLVAFNQNGNGSVSTAWSTSNDAQGNASDQGTYLAFDEVLQPGDCLDAIPEPELTDVSFVDCTTPHVAEILSLAPFTESPAASDSAYGAAFTDCDDLVDSTAPGARASGVVSADVWAPSDPDWADGARSGYCVLTSGPGMLTGSALDDTLRVTSLQEQT